MKRSAASFEVENFTFDGTALVKKLVTFTCS